MLASVILENAVISGYPIVLPAHRAAFHRDHPNWHKAWLDSIHTHLKPDDVLIDVGAEQGDLSALVASWLPDGAMYLVEPVAEFWPTIRDTFSANGLKSPLTGFVGFASNETTEIYLPLGWPTITPGEIVTDPGFQHLNERPDLPTITLDQLVGHPFPGATALIIDVEGAEFHVLKGAEDVLLGYPQVWCAIHPEIMAQRYDHDPNDLLAYMKSLGYEWELLGFAGEIHVRFYPT